MAKIFSIYKDDLDRAWFESSNVKYSECDDLDNQLKVVRIVFNNGQMYEYKDVNVNDYLMFREADSQGKAFNRYLRKYEFEKKGLADLEKIENDLKELTKEDQFSIRMADDKLEVFGPDGNLRYSREGEYDGETKRMLAELLEAIEFKYKLLD